MNEKKSFPRLSINYFDSFTNLTSEEESWCCGCSACQANCPKEAIAMERGRFGFLYPKVDQTKCVNCGICIKTCDFLTNQTTFPGSYPISAYGGRLNDETLLSESQSGGAFYALSDIIINQSGVVYGATLVNNKEAVHIRTTSKRGRDSMRKSKYIQSRIGNCFVQAKQDLERGETVLFSGTPCQIEGLKCHLKKDYDNLYTIDLICHGVPSPLVWEDYLSYLESKAGSPIEKVLFRDKTFGWGSHIESVYINKKKLSRDIFKNLFYDHLILRESCFNCPYARIERISDITIGDFWGWPYEDMNDKKGISLILVNSEKGRYLLKEASKYMELKKVAIDITLQPQLKHPAIRPKEMDSFKSYFFKHGFEKAAKKYAAMGWAHRRRFMRNKIKFIADKIKWHLGIRR